ncbi:MAG: YjbQ family protein [Planctomycetota bacterium]|nr:YjbQ family protein [Planctomycetota bacterium]
MIHQEQFSFETTGHGHMANVTDQVAAIVGRSGVKAGIVQVFCVGSTAAVGAIEFEPGLQRDLPEMLDRVIPPSRDYGHEQADHSLGVRRAPATADSNGDGHGGVTMRSAPARCGRRRSVLP